MSFAYFLSGIVLGAIIGRLFLRSKSQDKSLGSGTVVDTSMFIDGRLELMLKEGLIETPLVVPSRVIGELEAFAENNEKKFVFQHSRSISALKYIQDQSFEEDDSYDDEDADQQVVLQALERGYIVASLDREVLAASSNKGLAVINPDTVLSRVRPVIRPGELLRVFIYVRRNKSEMIGLTDYGEVVRVKGAPDKLGTSVNVNVTKISLQPTKRTIYGEFKA